MSFETYTEVTYAGEAPKWDRTFVYFLRIAIIIVLSFIL